MRATGWVLIVLAACGDDPSSSVCKDSLLPGDLVITEVFADYAAPTGGTGTDEGKEWFELYNASGRALSLKGVKVTHSRPDGSKPNSFTFDDVTVAAGEYFSIGNAASDLVPPYVNYGYGAKLGDLFNADGGKLSLACGNTDIDTALYAAVKSGHSRQLSSHGVPDYAANDDQVNWCEAVSNEFEPNNFGTPGAANDCAPVVAGACYDGNSSRAIVSPEPGDLVITEVMPSPTKVSDTVGEWFEVKALADVDLNGLGLDRAGDSANPNLVDGADCVHIAAGDYAIFAKSLDVAMNGGLPYPAGKFTFSLTTGSVAAPGDIRVMRGDTVIDAISWTTSTSGKSLQLDRDRADAMANDEPTNFCNATAAYGLGDLGTPGAENGVCTSGPPSGMCDDNGTLRPIVTPAAGQLVITEVMPSPSKVSDTVGEWFEVKALADIDLNGLGLDRAGDSANPNIVASTSCLHVPAGGYAVFAKSTDSTMNGGIPVAPNATFSFSLVSGTMAAPGDVRVLAGQTVIDAITWTSSRNGKALQLDRDSTDAIANDDTASFCDATATYGLGDVGTPGSENALCGAPPSTGMCDDNGTPRAIVSPAPGQLVITEVMPKPTAVSATAGQWFEVQALADVDLNGLGLDRANDTSAPTVLTSTACIHMATGSYGVFARSGDSSMNGGITVLGTFPFSINPTTVTPDVQLVLGTTVIDAVTWTTSTSGKSRSLSPSFSSATANDDPANWCDAQTIYNGNDRGTPGAANDMCGIAVTPGQCLDQGTARAIVKPAATALVINEYLANPAGAASGVDAAQEWFEIVNVGAIAFDLNDLGVQGSGTSINLVQSATCKSIAPGGFALFAHSTDSATNGGLPAVDATFTFAIGNSSGRIQVLDGTTVLDAIAWTTGSGGPDGIALQLDPAMRTTTANDTPPLNFCQATQTYGSAANKGTPKAANTCN